MLYSNLLFVVWAWKLKRWLILILRDYYNCLVWKHLDILGTHQIFLGLVISSWDSSLSGTTSPRTRLEKFLAWSLQYMSWCKLVWSNEILIRTSQSDFEHTICVDKLWLHFVCQNLEKICWLVQTSWKCKCYRKYQYPELDWQKKRKECQERYISILSLKLWYYWVYNE
jgi:hypothetical protein